MFTTSAKNKLQPYVSEAQELSKHLLGTNPQVQAFDYTLKTVVMFVALNSSVTWFVFFTSLRKVL